MNERERFLAVLRDHDPSVPTMKWEFGYWGETLNNWYRQGLRRQHFAEIPRRITSISSSCYTTSWISRNKYVGAGEYPKGYAIMGGGLYYPTQGFALDEDVRAQFGMDRCQRLIDLNLFFYPMFEPKILREDEDQLVYRDVDGVTRVYLKESATMASGSKWPIATRADWEELKAERLSLSHVEDRLPENWEALVQEYRDRDYPLGFGGYPLGFFGTLAHLVGYEGLFYLYYDDPELVHDMLSTFTDLWIAVFERVLKEVKVDFMQIWEDISFGNGSMLSLDMMNAFMRPYYKRLTGFLKAHGVDVIFVDTDGDCNAIIPFFLEAGATAMYPFEVHCGMDVLAVRKRYPQLAVMGGIPKSELAKGKARIDELLVPVRKLLNIGGYVPFADHFIPPEVSFEDFSYYRTRLNEMIDRCGR